uniref:Uncharacterized protein n=1 Tax=Cacopsylla melanoneura TaxID=428564 RepID=A0A8D8ZEV1_9HEMI
MVGCCGKVFNCTSVIFLGLVFATGTFFYLHWYSCSFEISKVLEPHNIVDHLDCRKNILDVFFLGVQWIRNCGIFEWIIAIDFNSAFCFRTQRHQADDKDSLVKIDFNESFDQVIIYIPGFKLTSQEQSVLSREVILGNCNIGITLEISIQVSNEIAHSDI